MPLPEPDSIRHLAESWGAVKQSAWWVLAGLLAPLILLLGWLGRWIVSREFRKLNYIAQTYVTETELRDVKERLAKIEDRVDGIYEILMRHERNRP